MVQIYYSPGYVGSGYSFDTTRKARWVADSLLEWPIPDIELVAPPALSRAHLEEVHCPEYVNAVERGQPRRVAESQGFDWDPGLWPMVLETNGGVVAAALEALHEGIAGSLSSGLHHAKRASGAGFCTFNGLVIAARAALAAGAGSVLILDLDAHCGGGTAALIEDEPRIWQIDVSVNRFDAYSSSERAWLNLIHDAEDYIPAVRTMLDKADRSAPQFGLCLYNAGMDPYDGCPKGGLSGITMEMLSSREQMVFDWCVRRGIPIAFVLAGGYIGEHLDRIELVELHRLTLSFAAAAARPRTIH